MEASAQGTEKSVCLKIAGMKTLIGFNVYFT